MNVQDEQAKENLCKKVIELRLEYIEVSEMAKRAGVQKLDGKNFGITNAEWSENIYRKYVAYEAAVSELLTQTVMQHWPMGETENFLQEFAKL